MLIKFNEHNLLENTEISLKLMVHYEQFMDTL